MNLRAGISKKINNFFDDETSIFWLVGLLFLGFLVFLLFSFSSEPKTLANWSSVGASFGALSALFTGLAFAGLIVTIVQQKRQLGMQSEELKLQRKELKATRKVLKKQNKEFRLQSETMRRQQFEGSFSYINKLLLNKLDLVTCVDSPNLHGEIAVKTEFNFFLRQMYVEEDSVSIRDSIFDVNLNKEEFLCEFYVNFASSDFNLDLISYLDDLILVLKYVNERGDELLMDLYRSQIYPYTKAFLFYRYICGDDDEVIKKLMTLDVRKILPDSHKIFFDALLNNEKIPWS